MTEETEKKYVIVWKADSPNPGLVEPLVFKESELATHNADEVLGPYREYVEAVPGTMLYYFYVGTDPDNKELHKILINHDSSSRYFDWMKGDVVYTMLPQRNWDDVRLARNQMLAGCDNMFNVDTPDPLKSEWIEYRQLLRDMISREEEAGRTPETVFWHDYVPPYPPTARMGVPDDIKPKCVWYKGEKTYPPSAIIGSPEMIAMKEEAERLANQPAPILEPSNNGITE